MTQANQFNYIAPTTSAKVSPPLDTRMYDTLVVSADNLSGGETINILTVVGTTNIQVLKLDGTAATLTATTLGLILKGGTQFVFDKSATAVACGLYVDPTLK